MQLEIVLAFVLASVVLIALPGPTVLFLIACTLNRGWRVAASAMLGVIPGVVACIGLSALGLGAVLATSAMLFTVIKWLGAIYLVYLGIAQWRRGVRVGPDNAPRIEALSARVLWQGFLVSTLNPKLVIFFAAFMPQFIDPTAAAGPQLLVLSATFVALMFPICGLYIGLAALFRRGLTGDRAFGWLNRVAGATMIGAGALAAAVQSARAYGRGDADWSVAPLGAAG